MDLNRAIRWGVDVALVSLTFSILAGGTLLGAAYLGLRRAGI